MNTMIGVSNHQPAVLDGSITILRRCRIPKVDLFPALQALKMSSALGKGTVNEFR